MLSKNIIVIEQSPIILYVKQNRNPPPIFGRGVSNPIMREYTNKVEESFQAIKDKLKTPGWYLWINVDKGNQKSTYIYAGQSQTNNTSDLFSRLREEFGDERMAFWATVYGDVIVREEVQRYPHYEKPIQRAARKKNVSHVIWFGKAGITNDELNYVEHQLIGHYNPTANKRKPKYLQSYPELLNEAISFLNSQIALIAKES